MYSIIRKFFFRYPAEEAHYMAMRYLKTTLNVPFGKQVIESLFAGKSVERPVQQFKLNFKNPVGLGAGFDKNAQYLSELKSLGFGFVEIGTVTPFAQEGNPMPRLFRLPEDQALINRMGFNNEGADVIATRLENWHNTSHNQSSKYPLIIGGNIGKNKVTPNEDAWKDYQICFNKLHPFVDYFVVNVSSPNTPGLRELQEKESLKKIILNLAMINNGKAKAKPLLLKIAPDLTQEQVDDVIELALEIKLDGLVVSNTTIDRNNLKTSIEMLESIGAGGLSGLPVQEKNTTLLQYIHQQTNGSIPIIGSGGIFNGYDAKEKIRSGASLVQVWTGFIYEGPSIVKNICNII